MATKPTTCSRCGNKISNGLNYSRNGKFFCYHCFQELQNELQVTEEDQQELYRYIKQLFGVVDIPSNIISFIANEVAGGKKYKGIKFTLYYYYEVMENPKNNIDTVIYTIRDQYKNAREYKEKINALKAINEQVDLSNIPTRTVLIPLKELEEDGSYRKKKKKYDIGDL